MVLEAGLTMLEILAKVLLVEDDYVVFWEDDRDDCVISRQHRPNGLEREGVDARDTHQISWAASSPAKSF